MRKLLFFFCIPLLVTSPAGDPDNIIVKLDALYGGTQITDAVYELWPSCYVETYSGPSWPGFITALQGGEWDMCVVAAVANTTNDGAHYDALIDYYVENGKLHYYDWYAHNHYNDDLELAMGVGNPTSMSFTPMHYVWDTGHDIVQGIDSWELHNHGWTLLTYHQRYPWTDAHPVTGWTASQTGGQAGFLEAENGEGVITGLYAGFIGVGLEQELWENILGFMWGSGSAVEETSWGAIKAEF